MEISYVAGFFDGEGCICISKHTSTVIRREGYHLVASISQRKKETLIEIQKIFGGRIYGNGDGRSFRWEVVRKNEAQTFLTTILPHLQLKRSQAKVGLLFLDLDSGWHQGERELCRKIIKMLKE